jgi:hypothetical protein
MPFRNTDRLTAQAPYQYQHYPKWKYHPSESARVVPDAAAEHALGDAWSDTPDAAAATSADTSAATDDTGAAAAKRKAKPKK